MYIVLIGLVLVVYAKILPKSASSSSRQSASVKEIEETMEHFAAELDEQNQAVIQLFNETKQNYESHLAKLAGRLEWLEKQNAGMSQEIAKLQIAHAQLEKQWLAASASVSADRFQPASPEIKGVPVPHIEDKPTVKEPEPPANLMNIQERYAELFQLYRQGKSADYIAKKLGMNKGEISLIIQLAKQEESLRA